MAAATVPPNDFAAGRGYPSPVTQVIGLGYYDGVTSGVLRTTGEAVYAFDMIDEVFDPDGNDLRRFELKPLPADAFEVITAAIGRPEWPVWIPRWEFPTADAQAAVDEVVRNELRRASPPVWWVEARDIAGEVETASRAGETPTGIAPMSGNAGVMTDVNVPQPTP